MKANEQVCGAAKRYLSSIRSRKKRLYGFAYYRFILGKRSEPDYHEYGISAMAAQAVRNELNSLVHVLHSS